ncbi:MAG: DUF1080 domain-containing protein [Gemmataceae bacterium]|nr:DUF1080 domain-containing protein [Gemmataceae bacterium]
MKRIVSLLVLMLLVLPSGAADEAKANTLTAKEVADGWLLLFDGESTFGWKIDGDAEVKDGNLVLGGERETAATFTTRFGEIDLRFQYSGDDARKVKVYPLAEKADSGFALMADAGNKQWVQADYRVRKKNGVSGTFKTVGGDVGAGFAAAESGQDAFPKLQTAVKLVVPKGVRLSLRDVRVHPQDLQSIFNGKDLSGWKEHAGKKSVFSVTKEGWINIKNGPGDLQTEGQWDDFVLQLECISNGKGLNSGVFFRCRPGEYQQGYEAQIHNGFTEQPMREYTLQTFDPESGKVIDTKKVKYTATDFGTGAVYNRQPARKQVSKDNEWFTMTVVAQGRHVATWVNGVQVVDWTDTRPVKDNARQGARLEKGPISLQGHDPTTDLSFRNFRIAELPRAAEKK